jgi:hypothetical protein
VTRTVVVEVEEALGPGLDFEDDHRLGLVGRRARSGGSWVGFDRGALVDSDDGSGGLVPVVIGMPGSTFKGARVLVELIGGWRTDRGVVLLGRVPGSSEPLEPTARMAARISDDADVLDAAGAERAAQRAHQRHRERSSHARIVGGRAWHGLDAEAPETARFGTPHSLAEYSLRRLPPRFVRGLAGLLDDGERVLYWVERPALADAGLLQRLRGVDRRAALLVLTDRQLVWIVDHAQPDRFLSDWGVDVVLQPIERVRGVVAAGHADSVALTVSTPAGDLDYRLPLELSDEVGVLASLLARFTPSRAADLPVRTYAIAAFEWDRETAERYGQAADADQLHRAAAAGGEILAFLYAPRREAQRAPAALVLRQSAAELVTATSHRVLSLRTVRSIRMTISPIVGLVGFSQEVAVSYPGPLAEPAAAFVRLARRVMAGLQ